MKIFGTIIILLLVASTLIIGIFSLNNSHLKEKNNICGEETKKCPNGSFVHKMGPKCEFAKCTDNNIQKPIATSSNQDTKIVIPDLSKTVRFNKKIIINGISITPIEVVADDRCPVDAKCIWPDVFVIRIKIENATSSQISRIKLDSSIRFYDSIVEFKSVLPKKYSATTIKIEDYFFEFSVTPVQKI